MQDSRLDHNQVFVATATVAAHAQFSETGFRHRDVKFLVELFSNWVEGSDETPVLNVQHTQVKRYLEALVAEGYARLAQKKQPHFRLTRPGLLELISRLVHRSWCNQRPQFFFLYYFIRNYKPRITELVRKEGRDFPHGMRLELEELLDERALLNREIAAAEKEIKKAGLRINDAGEAGKLARKMFSAGRQLDEVSRAVERAYPYELNSQKPLHELLSSIPEELRRWELETGTDRRMLDIWQPCEVLLKAYLGQLRRLS